jgi:hypothetical protein
MVVLAVALVILLPNKVAVRWGAASPANNFFSSSSLCVLPLFLLSFFSFLSCLSLFDFSLFSRPLLCFSALKILYFSFFFSFLFLFLFCYLSPVLLSFLVSHLSLKPFYFSTLPCFSVPSTFFPSLSLSQQFSVFPLVVFTPL